MISREAFGASASGTNRVKCLLVDDRPENLLALSALLRGPDVELLQAASGHEALEMLLAHEVALVLMDVQMPGMDGFEVAELMRGSERTRDVPIIFITAAASDAERMFRGYDSGAVDFLHKPVDPRVLRNKAAVFFELHRRRERLHQQLTESENSLRFNEMFMAVLGHDLRSPINVIGLGAELLTRSTADATSRDIGRRIQNSATHMGAMIEDLLDVVRARQAGGLPVDRRIADLSQIAESVVGEQRFAHPDREIGLKLSGALHGAWDNSRLQQMLTNLLVNALRHGDRGRPVQVEVDGSDSARVVVAVRNGGEIAQELQATLFDPFRRVGRDSDRSKGLGLGLYIADQIAHAHGGTIQVESSPESGVEVRVVLPR